MAFDFDALKPEAKKAAFAKMDRKKKAAGKLGRSGKAGGGKGGGSAGGNTSGGSNDASQPKARTAQQKIADAYAKLTPDNIGGVSITDLRRKIGGLTRDEEDTALRELSRTGQANIYPEANRKLLTADDHDAAVMIGNEPNHQIAMKPQKPAAAPAANKPNAATPGSPAAIAEVRRQLRAQDKANRDPNRTVAVFGGGRITVKDASARIAKSRAAAKMATKKPAKRPS